jgi:hypothetical protein
MTVNTAGGVTLFIGDAVLNPLTATLASLDAETYIEVGEVEDAGQVGDESADISFTALLDARTRHFKGARNAGVMTVVVGHDSTDEGQEALINAEATTWDYAFKVQLNDATSLTGEGTIFYFAAKVMSKRINIGNVANVVKATYQLAVDTALFFVAPT